MASEDSTVGVFERLKAARNLLEGGDLPAALAVYEGVLASDGDDGDVLAALSGDLGSTGNIAPIVELIAPRYDPERHGPAAGLNLLQAYLALGDPDSARHILDVLEALNRPELEERLLGFSSAIAQLLETGAAAGIPGSPAPAAAATGTAVSISKPAWFYGLEPLVGLILPEKSGNPRRIAFAQLGLPGAYPDVVAAMKLPEDEAGRLSRALPAWLAETFHYSAQYAPVAAFGIANQPDGMRHTVVFDADWTIENLRQLVKTSRDGLDYIFTGTLAGGGGAWALTLRLWEVRKFRERRQFTARWTPGTADTVLAGLRDELCRFMEFRPHPDLGGGIGRASGSPRAWLEVLGVSVGLFLAGKQLTPAGLLGPVGPALRELEAMAEGDPVAALAWLTTDARVRELGLDRGGAAEHPPLADHPVVAQARRLFS